MESTKLIRRAVKSNKKSFSHTFNVLVALEEQIERLVLPYFEQYEMPSEKRKHINEWMHKSKETRNNYQKLIEEGFDAIETFF